MAEIQKYNLKEKLKEADIKYKNSPAVCGMSSMTNFRYNNSTRTQMLTAHLNQVINMPNPQFSRLMTNAENTVGKHSSGYKELKHDIEVYRKVIKFEDLVGDSPFVYHLFYFDLDEQKFKVVKRKPAEDLLQNYGYKYNNELIDSLVEGEKVSAGTILYRSTSYDGYMNYRFGANLNTIYSYDPHAAEDSAILAERASWILSTFHSQVLGWGWNNNDIPINLYGGDEEYRPLPLLGETVEGYVAAARPQINEQLAYDFTHKNLKQVRDGDRTIQYNGTGQVVDFDIYCNNPEIPDNSFNRQILQMLDSQRTYWTKINETCLEIMNSGEKYSSDIDRIYDRSNKFLDDNPKLKWHNGKSVFGNLEFRCHIIEESPMAEGGKMSPRYGNKSVVGIVVPDYLMPFTEDGKQVDVILFQAAITNRTTGYVPHEMHINWITELTVDEMKKTTDRKKQEKLMFDVMKDLNKDQYEKMRHRYNKLTKEEKADYLDSVMANGIVIHQDNINEDESIFFKLYQMKDKYPYLKEQTLYQYKWGQVFRCASKYCIGKMYFMPLKQTDQRGFSARNTGAVNMKGLPERSYKNKRHEAVFSDTAIRFGEYESLNFMIGMQPEELALTHALYRSSPEAMSDLTKAQFARKGYAKFKKYYKSRAASIFSVIYKSLGLGIRFRNRDNEIRAIDSKTMKEHIYRGKSYICTDYEFYQIELRDRVRDKILNENVIMNGKELERRIEEELAKAPTVNGEQVPMNIFGTTEELTDD